jgi:hypothetical protein
MSIPAMTDSTPGERGNHILPTLGMVISAQFSASCFAKHWSHCNQLANYIARYASAGEPDPERQSTLLSTFFNEVLEVLYRNHRNGQIRLTFQKKGRRLSLRVEVPADERSRKFYQSTANLVNRPDLDAWYRGWLERAPGDMEEAQSGAGIELNSAAAGMLELVAVYDSVFRLEESKDSCSMLLYFEFPYGNEDME